MVRYAFPRKSVCLIICTSLLLSTGVYADWKDFLNEGLKKVESAVRDELARDEESPSQDEPAGESLPVSATKADFSPKLVRRVQRLLAELGYEPGPVDGQFGHATERAIEQYQRDEGIAPTGRPSRQLSIQLAESKKHKAAQPGQSPSQGTTVASSGGIRQPMPHAIDGRIISGFPLSFGPLAQRQVEFGMRPNDDAAARFELGLYLDLAVLKQWPQILDDRQVVYERQDIEWDHERAYNFASRLLERPVLRQYLAECDVYGCGPDRREPYHSWLGNNEFERESAYRKFLEQVVPQVLSGAPDLPIELTHVVEVKVEPYDDGVSGFSLADRGRATGPASNLRLQSDLRLIGDPEMPEAIIVPREQAPALLAELGEKRLAYLAYDVSVAEPKWNYQLDYPTLQTSWSAPRLYADAELQHVLHTFEAAVTDPTQQAQVKESQPHPPPIMPADRSVAGKLNVGLLIYKHAPELFDQERLRQAAGPQFLHDRAFHENDSPSSHSAPYTPVFTRAETEGAVAGSLTQQLFTVYEQRLAALAAQMPSRVTVSKSRDVGDYLWEAGSLKPDLAGRRGGSADYLMWLSAIGDNDKQRLPELGAREVLRMPVLRGEQPPLPFSANSISPMKQIYLALDRVPDIPHLALDENAAKPLWSRPDCVALASRYVADGLPPVEAEQRAKSCRDERERYSGQLAFDYDIEIENVVNADSHLVINARLIEARVYGSRDELLATLGADEFPPGVDIWQQARDREQQERRQEEDAEAARMAERQRLNDADIIGLRLGMSVSEAAEKVRAHMDVGMVVERSSTGKTIPGFDDLIGFRSEDGKEVIILHRGAPNDDKVVGIVRLTALPDEIEQDALVARLKEKYGPHPDQETSRTIAWFQSRDQELCRTNTGWPRLSAKQGDAYRSLQMPVISPVKSERQVGSEYYRLLKEHCRPDAWAQFHTQGLIVALVDLSAYAAAHPDKLVKTETVSAEDIDL